MIDSGRAWLRLAAAFWLMTIGAAGMWSVAVVLPAYQVEFGISRSEATLPSTMTWIGFAIGQIVMGRLTDRFGIFRVVALASFSFGAGFVVAGMAPNHWMLGLAQAVMIGFLGSAAMFGPLIADTSQWFARRRGLAVAIVASGNYVGGAIWPPVMQHFIDAAGWRVTYIGLGIFCFCATLPVAFALRARSPGQAAAGTAPIATGSERPLGLAPAHLQALLVIAGFSCCVAMAMPQVHIVAYCGDLGYGAARGAEMRSLMLGFGIVSRLGSGWIADRIGGLRTLLLGSFLQCVALVLFLPFDGLVSLYVVSALFGLFQGGIIPSYTIIVREHFVPSQAGARVGAVMLATLVGMAAGGWISGLVFDFAGSYRAAFVNGIAWNLVNLAIVGWLTLRWRRGLAAA